jgi:ribosomal protein L6P/L9E
MIRANNFLIRLNIYNEKFSVGKNFLKVSGGYGALNLKRFACLGATKSKLFSLNFFGEFRYKRRWLKEVNKLNSLSYANKNLFKTIFSLRNGVLKKLKINGIGFRLYTKKDFLILKSSLSHLIFIKVPENVSVRILKNRVIFLHGYEIEKLRYLENAIYGCFIPDPFKGKGVHKDFSIIYLKKYKKN